MRDESWRTVDTETDGLIEPLHVVEIAAHVIMHVANGKVTKLFGIFDEAGLLRQLGILPAN